MRQKDLKDIPRKGFTKSWWGKHRSSKAAGTGVGKALDQWNAAKMPPSGKVVALQTGIDFKAAIAAVTALDKALSGALAKAKGRAKDTADGIIIYQKELTRHHLALNTEYGKRVGKFKLDREEVVAVLKSAVKDLTSLAKVAEELAGAAEKLENDANDALSKGTVEEVGARLVQVTDKLEREVLGNEKTTQQRYEQDAKFVKERRGSKYNANSYGVMKADGDKLASIFAEATKLTNDTGALLDKVKTLTADTRDSTAEARKLLTSGQRDVGDSANLAKTTADSAAKLAKDFDDTAHKGKSGFETLEKMAKKPSPVDEKIRGQVKMYLMIVDQAVKRTNAIFNKLKSLVDKNGKRIPSEHKRTRTVKPHWDRAAMALMQAITAKKALTKKVSQAKKDAKTILNFTG